ncbi:hypothetical protein M758_UG284100 [Ceratodon purpureus]|nr:hypothetical protein M758_UG284100 [Ceratodon purpureus]
MGRILFIATTLYIRRRTLTPANARTHHACRRYYQTKPHLPLDNLATSVAHEMHNCALCERRSILHEAPRCG